MAVWLEGRNLVDEAIFEEKELLRQLRSFRLGERSTTQLRIHRGRCPLTLLSNAFVFRKHKNLAHVPT